MPDDFRVFANIVIVFVAIALFITECNCNDEVR